MTESPAAPANTPADGDAALIIDALARGRLAPAEIAAIAPLELDALYEIGARRLDTGRDHEAAAVFAGLVALFPYTARYWRAYGIALHRCVEAPRAKAAYDAALALEPDHPETLCYRAEVHLFLGDLAGARRDLAKVRAAGRKDLARRAAALSTCIDTLAARGYTPPPAPTPPPVQEAAFTLADGRSLPLPDSPLAETDVAEDLPLEDLPPEITNTATSYAPPIADLFEPPLPLEPQTTDVYEPPVAPKPRRRRTQALRRLSAAVTNIRSGQVEWDQITGTFPGAPPPEALDDDTGVVQRAAATYPGARSGKTDIIRRPALRPGEAPWEASSTDVLPGRQPAIDLMRALEAQRLAETPMAPETTRTGVVRRRQHLPLTADTTDILPAKRPLAEENTATLTIRPRGGSSSDADDETEV